MKAELWLILVASQVLSSGALVHAAESPWPRHTIDNSSRGADGIRALDLNRDGLMDLVTGWEEGGAIRVYLNPGKATVKQPWPRITVGEVSSPEDAVPVDLDGRADLILTFESATGSKAGVAWAQLNSEPRLSANHLKTSTARKVKNLTSSPSSTSTSMATSTSSPAKKKIFSASSGTKTLRVKIAAAGQFSTPTDPRG